MKDNKQIKRGRGKPPRYAGEEQERLSIMIRPRYKKALEMLKQHRQCNLTEATELAIVNLASDYEVDGKPLIDYVRPESEPFRRYFEHAISEEFLHADVKDDEETLLQNMRFLELNKYLEETKAIPASILGNFESFNFRILESLAQQEVNIWKYLDKDALSSAIKEDWKEGRAESDCMMLILLVIKVAKAYRLFGAKNKLENFNFQGNKPVEITQKDSEQLQKWLSSSEWKKLSSCFKIQ